MPIKSKFFLAVIVIFSLMPLLVIIASWGFESLSIWNHYLGERFLDSLLFRWISHTLFLCVGVAIGVSFLGVSLALFVSFYDFPLRRFFSWSLMLPLAMPAYVMAFVYLGIFDFSGPVQQFLKGLFGNSYSFFQVRNGGSAIIVFSLVLYPYVYMLARSSFLQQGQNTIQAAQTLGFSPFQALIKVALPICRPAIIAGIALALMETLADFGAVSVFSFDTFTTAIYKSWYDFKNIHASGQIASLLLMFVLIMIVLEKRSRANASYRQQNISTQQLMQTSKLKQLIMTGFCLLIFSLSFILPVAQLIVWFIKKSDFFFDPRYFKWVGNTLTLGLLAACLTLVIATFLAWINQQFVQTKIWIAISTLGYALPSSILAIAIMMLFAGIDHSVFIPIQTALELPVKPILLGSVFALIIAYAIRFNAVAFGPMNSGFGSIRPSITEAGLLLGSSGFTLFRRIHLPILRPSVYTAFLLVLVDTMKEMPATLLMRPYGWDTLAVKIFEYTSEGEWELAAVPALTLVCAGLIPVIFLVSKSQKS
ncbi:ABC transporter permease [Marinicellulosiphila megalodicopiae]|uniref:ABC transporter permease n=1 Tax=Marinicellulosiphila megalodicopiae TaxID=2724896 RepID=UPI003BAF8F95